LIANEPDVLPLDRRVGLRRDTLRPGRGDVNLRSMAIVAAAGRRSLGVLLLLSSACWVRLHYGGLRGS